MHIDIPMVDHRVQHPIEHHRPIEVSERSKETPEMKEARRIWTDIVYPLEKAALMLYKDSRWHDRGVELENFAGDLNEIRQKLIKIYYPTEDKKLPPKKKK